LEDQGVDLMMGSGRILGRLVGDVECIYLAKGRGRWRTVVDTVTILWDPPLSFTSISPSLLFKFIHLFRGSLVSSGSIVSDYWLDDRAIGVRSPAGAKDSSSNLCVQTGSGAHPASCTMSTGGPFPGGKERPGRDADHSPPSSAEVVNE
jgi:hypothetical protein